MDAENAAERCQEERLTFATEPANQDDDFPILAPAVAEQ